MRMSVEVEGLDEALRRLKAYDTKSTEKFQKLSGLADKILVKKRAAVYRAEAGNSRKSIRHKVRQYGYNIYCPH